MLTRIADGVLVHESDWCQSNTVVVQGTNGVLVVDPGIHAGEMTCLAQDLADSGQSVVAGFSTHPHWDHLLWHTALGDPPRYSTGRCADTARVRLAGGIDRSRFGIPEDTSLELVGLVTGLPVGASKVPWDGPDVRIVEHQAHAPGHAALLVEAGGVLVAGDMLSDVFIPMLDLNGTANPIADYLDALQLFEGLANEVNVLVPGHGSVATPDQLRARIERDRRYVLALRDGQKVDDPRIGPSAKPGWEWVADVHAGQVNRLAETTGGGPPG